MTHIDQHTLELFVLGSASIQAERRRISRHLARCEDCRRLAEEFRAIYDAAEAHTAPHAAPESARSRDVVHSGFPLARSPRENRKIMTPPLRGPVSRFIHVYTTHPVAAGGGTLAGLALLVLGVLTLSRPSPEASNPVYTHYDTAANYLEVYNASDRLLWKKPSRLLASIEAHEVGYATSRTVVSDLDDDGRNEVLTLVPGFTAEGHAVDGLIRTFETDGELRWSRKLGDRVTVEGREYDAGSYGAGALVVLDGVEGKEIVVIAPHWRSPTMVARFDRAGRVLGEYWHYGHISGAYRFPSSGGASRKVLMIAVNDTGEKTGDRFPAVIVLDAERIQGRSQSPATPVFGFARSNAEDFYIRLPLTDMDAAMKVVPAADRLTMDESGSVRVRVVSGEGSMRYGLDYVFHPDMTPLAVYPIDGAQAVRAALMLRGQVSGPLDSRYLAALVDSVRYRAADGVWHRTR